MSQQHELTVTRLGSERDPAAIANDAALKRIEAEIKHLWQDPGDHEEFCHKVAQALLRFHESVQVHPSDVLYYYLHSEPCFLTRICQADTPITVGDPYKMPIEVRIRTRMSL